MPRDDDADDDNNVVPFPQSRVTPSGKPFQDLGYGKTAQALGVPRRQLFGHWCSRCEGIWYGTMLEVECPRCGNRDG